MHSANTQAPLQVPSGIHQTKTELPLSDSAPDAFLVRNRKRRIAQSLLALGLLAGAMAAWKVAPARVDRLLALSPAHASDDPRGIFPEPSPESPDHVRLHAVFEDALPRYLEALRAATLDPTSSTAIGLRTSTAQALLTAANGDEALHAALSSLTRTLELDLERNRSAVEEHLGNLQALVKTREWPIVVEGSPVQEERGTFLNLRIYERVGYLAFRTDAGAVQIPVLDRFNLQSLVRHPEPQRGSADQPVVYARRVWMEAGSGLLSALHEGGTYRLTSLTPTSQTVQILEKALAKQSYASWNAALAPQVNEVERQALSQLSTVLDERNALYRQINDRDPRRLSITYPAGIAGETGRAHLAQLEPYALQGKIRLTIEDLNGLKQLDRTLEQHLAAALPAVRAVQEQLFRQEGIRALHARHVQSRAIPNAVTKVAGASISTSGAEGAAVPMTGPEALSQISLQAGVLLGELAQTGGQCQTSLARLGSLALEGTPEQNTAARVVVRQLLPNAPDLRPQEGFSMSLATLATQDCAELTVLARDAYTRMYGAFPNIEPITNIVATSR